MFQKRMQRAAMVLLVALLLTPPLHAAGWTSREAPGLLETAWSWLAEWLTGTRPAQPALRSGTAANEVPTPPKGPGGEIPSGPSGDDGGGIDPDG